MTRFRPRIPRNCCKSPQTRLLVPTCPNPSQLGSRGSVPEPVPEPVPRTVKGLYYVGPLPDQVSGQDGRIKKVENRNLSRRRKGQKIVQGRTNLGCQASRRPRPRRARSPSWAARRPVAGGRERPNFASGATERPDRLEVAALLCPDPIGRPGGDPRRNRFRRSWAADGLEVGASPTRWGSK